MYHCYFLINYIGPPKVFFLSFGPLFKKFAHHWYRPCSVVQFEAAGYPLHSHLSPSLPLPCVTVCHQIPNALYFGTRRGEGALPWPGV